MGEYLHYFCRPESDLSSRDAVLPTMQKEGEKQSVLAVPGGYVLRILHQREHARSHSA